MVFSEGLIIVRHAECIEVRNRSILDAMVFPKGLIIRHAECIEVINRNILDAWSSPRGS